MTQNEDADSDIERQEPNDDSNVEPPVVPKFSIANLKSQVSILRIVQMVLCLTAFICLQVSIKCKWLHNAGQGTEYYTQLCDCPSDFIYRCYSASTAIVFFLTFCMFCIHVGNLMAVLTNISWRLVILIHTGSCSLALILAIAILGHGNYVDDSGLLMAVHFFGLFAALAFALHFFWELILWKRLRCPGISGPSEARDNVTYEASDLDADDRDSDPGGGYIFADDNNDTDGRLAPSGSPMVYSIKKRNSYSLEFMTEDGERPNVPVTKKSASGKDIFSASTTGSNSSRSADGIDRPFHGYNNSTSSGSDDKRSWVVTDAKEDTLSTGTYTVDVPLQ